MLWSSHGPRLSEYEREITRWERREVARTWAALVLFLLTIAVLAWCGGVFGR